MFNVKIAFASEGKGIDAFISKHFGRSRYYVFVEIENKKVKKIETKENPFSESHEPGDVPGFVYKEGADVIVSGGMGPKAMDWFRKHDVKPVITGAERIEDVLKKILKGEVKID
ncbi:MAG: dinitrogenase iron-molybdenum cofactor [Candidatus Aenigmatarchaeota archaeon]|nr:MAG: dinitrogenase iron-molybdenum cofactor [Candidatus Aenigmarchaeota archaeon]